MAVSIITHRGLDPDQGSAFPMESSIEAFTDHLERGYGIEFDVRLTKDGKTVVIHDGNLTRCTSGRDERAIDTLAFDEIQGVDFNGSHLTDLPTLLNFINAKQQPGQISALHIKSGMQEEGKVSRIMDALIESGIDPEKLIIFDLKAETARFIKSKWPQFALAASVSHPYDAQRYNEAVGHTLLFMEKIIENKDLFSWAWLDEWDRRDGKGGDKTLYNKEVFEELRKHDIKIALVTTELHFATPGQLGGGDHEDGEGERLDARNREIVSLCPDAICTDHPDRIRQIIK